MPQNSHKHHFIPCFYLRQWAGDDGKIAAWSRPHELVIDRRNYPEAVGWEEDLYSFPDLPVGTREWFEDHFLKHVDNLASDALHKIKKERTTQISPKERSAWTRFVFTLRYRHPDVLCEIRQNIKDAWEKQLTQGAISYANRQADGDSANYEAYLATLTKENHAQVHSRLLRNMMGNSRIGNRVNNMYWEIYEVNDIRLQFLTSDWPVELSPRSGSEIHYNTYITKFNLCRFRRCRISAIS